MSIRIPMPRLASLGLALALALAGCRTGTREPPRPLSVMPPRALEGPAVSITIAGANFAARANNDFGGSNGPWADDAFAARLGTTPLRQVRLDAQGNLTAVVPEGLVRDIYDLTVTDPWGNEGVLRAAFRVLAVGDLDYLLAGFRIQAVGPQRVNTPFEVTIEALDKEGRRLDWYNGSLSLSDRTGTAVPATIGFFTAGVWTGPVEIRAQHDADALTVTDGHLSASSDIFQIAPRAAVALRFTNPRQSAVARLCSGAITLSPVDATNFETTLADALDVAIEVKPADGVALFSDAACTQPLVAPRIDAQGRELRFHFKGDRAGSILLGATADGLKGDQQLVTVRPAAPARLAFVGGTNQIVVAGVCSAPLTVATLDAGGNAAVVSADVPVQLSATPADDFAFYADDRCQTPVAAPVIAAGLGTAQLWFRGTRAGAVVLGASGASLGSTATNAAIIAADPASLAFLSTPQTLIAGDCSAAVGLRVSDAFGNPAGPAAGLSLALNAPGLELFGATGCTGAPLAALTLAPGAADGQLWFRGAAEGSYALTVTLASVPPATQVETIKPPPPRQAFFVTPSRSIVAGDCSGAITVEARDVNGTPRAVGAAAVPIALASAAGSGLRLSTNPLCTGAVEAALFALQFDPRQTQATFYFTSTVAGSWSLDASVTDWAGARQTERVGPSTPVKVGLSPNPFTTTAGDCSAALSAALLDTWGNVAPAAVWTQIALGAAPDQGFGFYSDAACATPITGVAINAAADHTSFRIRSTRAGLILISASAAGLTTGSLTATITAKNPDRLLFSTPPRQINAGACSPVLAVQAQDSLGNPVAVFPAAALALSATGSNVTFYSDGSCAIPLAAPAFAAGSDTVSFYARATTAASNVTVHASAFGFDAVQPFAVDAGPAVQLAFDPVASPQAQFAPFAVTLHSLDVYGNATTAFGGDALLMALPQGNAACEANCRGAARTGRFASGVWTGAVSLDASGTGYRLVATAGSALGTSASFDVNAGPAQSPPRARLAAYPGAVLAGDSVTLDASGSVDFQTASAALQTAWDLSGSLAGAAPWGGPWAPALTATASWATPGLHRPRVAVRDGAQSVGYAAGVVLVVAAASDLCTVTTASLVDDGATSCGGPYGSDGELSLAEALRLANAAGGPSAITFNAGLRIEGTTPLAVTRPITIAGGGTVLAVPLQIGAAVQLLNIEIAGLAAPIQVDVAGSLQLIGVEVRDGAGLLVRGSAALEQVRFRNCVGDCLVDESGSGLSLLEVEMLSAPGSAGVRLQTCAAGAAAVDVRSSVFAGLRAGIEALCGRALHIRHVTFANDQTGVAFAGGSGHQMQNCVFASNSVRAAGCGTATFTARDHALLWSNAADGCIYGDPAVLRADPLFVDAAAGDYRLVSGSPAADSAVDLSLDVDGPAPGTFLGTGPDRGGAEWY